MSTVDINKDELAKMRANLDTKFRDEIKTGYQTLVRGREYVLYWTQKWSIKITPNGTISDPIGRYKDEIFTTMWLDYLEEVREHNNKAKEVNEKTLLIKPIRESDLKKALEENISLIKSNSKAAKKEEMVCEVEDLTELRRFVLALTGALDPLVVAVMAQFIWLVKRKLFNLKADYHIMPVIFGPQLAGKSSAVRELVKPMADFQLALRMNELTDSRYFFGLADNYVIVFDEMQKAATADIDILKNQVTQDVNTPRRLHSHDLVPVKQNCTFIGTTNKHLSDQIQDATGMRRFYQINSIAKIDWDTINTIDYLQLWKGVDEKIHFGYTKPVIDQITKVQESWTTADPMEAFAEEMGLEFPLKSESEDNDIVTVNQVYMAYMQWCNDNGYSFKLASNRFGSAMSNQGYKSKTISIKGSSTKCYEFPKGHKFQPEKRPESKVLG